MIIIGQRAIFAAAAAPTAAPTAAAAVALQPVVLSCDVVRRMQGEGCSHAEVLAVLLDLSGCNIVSHTVSRSTAHGS